MKSKVEFSKLMVGSVMLTYFFGVFLGAVVVITKSPDQLGIYLGYIGAPTATAIGFYAWKAKNENLIKIKQNGEIPIEDNNY